MDQPRPRGLMTAPLLLSGQRVWLDSESRYTIRNSERLRSGIHLEKVSDRSPLEYQIRASLMKLNLAGKNGARLAECLYRRSMSALKIRLNVITLRIRRFKLT